jgi:hypothetical protein
MPPVKVAFEIVATPPATVPLAVRVQVTGADEDGDSTVMLPVKLVNGPLGTIDAALAIEAAPKLRAKDVAQTRVLRLFIVFPHMLWRIHFARGNGHEREVTVKQSGTSLSSQISIQ